MTDVSDAEAENQAAIARYDALIEDQHERGVLLYGAHIMARLPCCGPYVSDREAVSRTAHVSGKVLMDHMGHAVALQAYGVTDKPDRATAEQMVAQQLAGTVSNEAFREQRIAELMEGGAVRLDRIAVHCQPCNLDLVSVPMGQA